MLLVSAAPWIGKKVLNGCGAVLGRVAEVRGDADGVVREILVRQTDGKEWHVEAYNIKHVDDAVHLKGPREGYHIAPLPPLALPAA
jgi:hypothetical protein